MGNRFTKFLPPGQAGDREGVLELEVPAGYGIVQPVGANVGPGGINRAPPLQALLMDPAVPSWETAAPMLDEMLKGTAAYLPRFR